MTVNDERALRERLDRAFEAITPRPAPVEGAVRRGRAIRVRRRVAAAVGVAAAVAIGLLATPALRHWQAAPAPATPAHRYTVTVQVPGPRSPAGLIASGTVNGKRWQLTASRPGAGGAARGRQSIMASGPAFGPVPTGADGDALAPDSSDPVQFQGFSAGPVQAQYGAVRAEVSYLKVRLGNGTVLTLRPASVYGVRLVGFAAPVGDTVAGVTAYSRHGEIATAIPFNDPGGFAEFAAWLKPGQHGIARASGRIGSGTAGGKAWSATAYLGPWGICIETSGSVGNGGGCEPTTAAVATSGLFSTVGTPGVVAGIASPAVAQVVVHRPDGTSFRIRPVTVGIGKFFVFATSTSHRPWKWAAYDGSGRVIASSQITPG